MMHNTYTTSFISLRTSISFNGHSYYSNERCPSSCCCCSCSIPPNSSRLTVPINPSFLYGLRQSTLIQLPPSRRLILGSYDRYCYRAPIHNAGQHYCGESCCVKHERVDRFVESYCKEECCVKKRFVRVNEGRSRMGSLNHRCSALGDAEAMLSLLTDESIEECLDVRGRKRDAVKEGKVFVKRNSTSDNSENVKDNGTLESEMKKSKMDHGRVQFRKEGHLRREEMKAFSRDDDRRSRRRVPSSSSNSSSNSSDLGSDMAVQINYGRFIVMSPFKHEKDLKTVGGIVVREETKQDSKTHREERFQSSTHDDFRVAKWDCRKKSEKKLTEESAKETKSNKISVVGQSQLSHAHESNAMKASCSRKQLNYQEGESSSGFHGLSRSRIKTDNRVNEYLKYSNRREQSMQSNKSELESTSNMHKISDEEVCVMVDAKSAQETGCEFCTECGEIMQQSKTQTDFKQHAELSETQDDSRLSLFAQTQSESRLIGQENNSTSIQSSITEVSNGQDKCANRFRMQEKSSTSLPNSLEENKQRHQVIHAAVGEINTGKESQNYSETVNIHGRYAESTLKSQKHSETRMKNLEDYSTSLVSRQEGRKLQEESSGKVIKETESDKESQTGLHVTQIQSTKVEINCQLVSEKRVHSEQTYLTSKKKSVEELGEKHNQSNETNLLSGIRTDNQGHVLQAGFTGNSSGETSVTQPLIAVVSHTGIKQVSEEVKSDTKISVLSPLYQPLEERSPYGEPSTSSVSNDHGSISPKKNGHGSITETYASVAYIEPQASPSPSSVEVNSSERKSFMEPSAEDALDSAKHMESIQIVGEFVEKQSHEGSVSDTKMEKELSQRNSKHQDEKYMLKGPRESGFDKISLQKQDPRGSSGASVTKEPSDEMMGVKNHLPQEPSENESLEGSTSEDGIMKRNGKSLWNILAGIFRLRWGSQSETHASTVKSGAKSSSNEWASGETHLSRNEPDEASGDRLQKRQASMHKKSIISDAIPLERTATKTRKQDLGVVSLSDKSEYVGVSASSSYSVLQTGLLLGVISSGANTNWNVTQQMPQSSPSLDLSVNPGRRLRRSHTSEEIEEVDKNEGLVISVGVSSDVRQTAISASEITDVELEQRKLQRSEQVLGETFDKWEDAYRLSSEQRKVDEIFMREALVEAKKAANSWEVPIGAVLVQNGKVIARGYNLVEELRDSTAHAEMICIKEASSALRTWRLSETTLYVTLEPCPMCAGAILQARIGTLVWSAPNKLLGADGSWIRLFPEGAEGEQRPEVADKPAALVHPFHPKMKIRRGVLEPECAEIMQQFFQLRRKKKKQQQEKKAEESGQPSSLPISHHPSKFLHKMHHILQVMFCL